MQAWIITLVVIAFALFLFEIFFIPGLGFAGIIAFIMLCTATYLASVSFGTAAAALIFFGMIGVVIMIFVAFLKSPLSGLLVLKSQLLKGQAMSLPLTQGMSGVSITDCHPSGKAKFMIDNTDRVIDVVTRGEFLDIGVQIEIIRIEGTRVLVRAKA